MRATQIFGNDTVLAYRTIGVEIERLRQGDGPAHVEAYTYRWNSHVGRCIARYRGYNPRTDSYTLNRRVYRCRL